MLCTDFMKTTIYALLVSSVLATNAYAADVASELNFREAVAAMDDKAWAQFEKDCDQARLEHVAGIKRPKDVALCAKASTVRTELKVKAWVSGKLDLLNLFR